MGKKPFVLVLSILIVAFGLAAVMQYYRPSSSIAVNFDNFPLEKGDWIGQRELVPDYAIDMLNPHDIFSAVYTNSQGITIHLMFDFFSGESTYGGPHSPRNCLPGSGWIIENTHQNDINVENRSIPADRFELRFENSRKVMEFWYVTSFGETANDYEFKFYTMLSSLLLQPADVAFVRFVTNSDANNLVALEEFQELFIPEIYRFLPFEQETQSGLLQ